MNQIVEWILAASYWICSYNLYNVYVSVTYSWSVHIYVLTLIPSYGMIKFYFSVLVIISMYISLVCDKYSDERYIGFSRVF